MSLYLILREHGINVSHKNISRKISNEDSDQFLKGTSKDTCSTLGDTSSTLMDIDCTSRDTYGTARDITSHEICRDTLCTSSDTIGTLRGTSSTSKDTGSTLRETYSTSKDNNNTIDRNSVDTDSVFMDNVSTSGGPAGASRDISGPHDSLHGNINGFEGTKQDAKLWSNVEHLMISSENDVKDNLETNGIFGEDLVEDEDGEEGQLWKVVEGKRLLSDVI